MVTLEDVLYRRYFDNEYQVTKEGRPHQGAFNLRKDEVGLSVSLRNGNNLQDRLIGQLADDQGIAEFSAAIPLQHGCEFLPDATDDDPDHHQILNYTKACKKQIVANASVVFPPRARL